MITKYSCVKIYPGMPFKTRRQKLSAAQRRYTLSENIFVDYQTSQKNTGSEETRNIKRQATTQSKLIEEDYGYIKTDLAKTLIFAGTIVAVQFIILLNI